MCPNDEAVISLLGYTFTHWALATLLLVDLSKQLPFYVKLLMDTFGKPTLNFL